MPTRDSSALVLTFLLVVRLVVDAAGFATTWPAPIERTESSSNPLKFAGSFEVAADGRLARSRPKRRGPPRWRENSARKVQMKNKRHTPEEHQMRTVTQLSEADEAHDHQMRTAAVRSACSESDVASACHAFANGASSSVTTRKQLKEYFVCPKVKKDCGRCATSLGQGFAGGKQQQVDELLDRIGITTGEDDDPIPCADLCHKCLSYVQESLHLTLDVAPSEAQIHEIARTSKVVDIDQGSDLVQILVESGSKATVEDCRFMHTVERLAKQVANIFNIYPSGESASSLPSLLEVGAPNLTFGDQVQEHRKDNLTFAWTESLAWVTTALKRLPDHEHLVAKWFGNVSNITEAMGEVRATLLGALETLTSTHLKKGSSEYCKDGVVAYVITYVGIETKEFEGSQKDDNGNDIIHVCEKYWQPNLYDSVSWRFGAMVHEAVHHQGALDQSYEGRSPYGHDNCLLLASANASIALQNADNYRWYVYEANADDSKAASATTDDSSEPSFLCAMVTTLFGENSDTVARSWIGSLFC